MPKGDFPISEPSYPKPKKLLDQLGEVIRIKHHSYSTEKTYVHWVKHEFSEVFKGNPLRLVTIAITEWTRHMTNVFMTLAVFIFAHRQKSLDSTMQTGYLDLNFEHIYLLFVGIKTAHLSSERRAWISRALCH
jgi:hypothetical protein